MKKEPARPAPVAVVAKRVARAAPAVAAPSDRMRTIGVAASGAVLAAIEALAAERDMQLGAAGLELIQRGLAPPPLAPMSSPAKPRLSPAVLRAWQADGGHDFLTRMIEAGVRAQMEQHHGR